MLTSRIEEISRMYVLGGNTFAFSGIRPTNWYCERYMLAADELGVHEVELEIYALFVGHISELVHGEGEDLPTVLELAERMGVQDDLDDFKDFIEDASEALARIERQELYGEALSELPEKPDTAGWGGDDYPYDLEDQYPPAPLIRIYRE